MKKKITFQVNEVEDDEYGGKVTKWVDYVTVWANIYPVRADKDFFGDKVEGRVTHIVEIRFRPDLKTEMRAIFYESFHEHGSLDTSYLTQQNDGKIELQNSGGIVLDRFKTTPHIYKIRGIQNKLTKSKKDNYRYMQVLCEEYVTT